MYQTARIHIIIRYIQTNKQKKTNFFFLLDPPLPGTATHTEKKNIERRSLRLIGDELLQKQYYYLERNLFALIKKRPTTTTKIISTTHKTKLPNEQCLGNSEV